jgi:predicted small integral membrane protein
MVTILFLVEAALVASLGTWMAVAVADNWRHPRLNEEAVAMVLRLELMAEQYPEEYRMVAHRRIDSPGVTRMLFRSIRLAETVAALALYGAAALLLLAALGLVAPAPATAAAVLSTAFFILIWGGFVIGGNYFAYWFCHQWAQSNHFMLMFWGFFVLVVLIV